MPIARPDYVRAISKVLGKERVFNWHNLQIEKKGDKY